MVKNKRYLSLILAFCVAINIFPIAFANMGHTDGVSSPTQWVFIAFIAQTILLSISVGIGRIIKENTLQLALFSALMSLAILIRFVSATETGSLNPLDFMGILVRWYNIVFLYIVCSKLFINEGQLLQFMKFIVWIGFIACLYNFVFNFAGIVNIGNLSNSYQANFKSFFANRNQFAIFLSIAANANLYLLKSGRYNRAVYKLLLLMTLICLLLTFSRTAIFSTLILCVLVIYGKAKRNTLKKYVLIISFIVCAIVLFSLPSTQHFVKDLIIREDSISDASGRKEIWSTGLGVLQGADIFFGMGEFSGLRVAEERGFEFTQFHSLFIDSLVFGGVFWLIVILYIILKTLSHLRKAMHGSKYFSIMLASYASFAVLSSFESLGLFGIGYVDTITTIFYVSIPLLYSNYVLKTKTERHAYHK